MNDCTVTGCRAPARRGRTFSRYCSAHRSRQRRHGHPAQPTVTAVDLKPHLRSIQRRVTRNPEAAVWGKIETRWLALVAYCRAEEAASRESGRASNRHVRRAVQEVLKIADSSTAVEAWQRGAAVFALQETNPGMFVSDRGFLFQLGRLMRQLSDMNVGVTWDHNSGRSKRCYRDVPPTVSEILGRMLSETLGAAGIQLARIEREQEQAKARNSRELSEALEELRRGNPVT